MNRTVIGIDIGRSSATCCILSEFPSNLERYFKTAKKNIVVNRADGDGVSWILTKKPQAIIMEPTGYWYSALWAQIAEANGIEVCWVGHADLAHQRGSYGLKNKTDAEDAFSLACCYFDERFIDGSGKKRFLDFPEEVKKLRRLFLESEQIDKRINQATNQIRQRLSYEFPEAAKTLSIPSPKLRYSPLWGWLAGIHSYKSIDQKYAKSIATTNGIEISAYTRNLAKQVVDLQVEQFRIDADIDTIVMANLFAEYRKVFARYGWTTRKMISLLLIQAYPIERFLCDGRELVDRDRSTNRQGKVIHKTTNRSRKSFQLYLGTGRVLSESGESSSWTYSGSSIFRAHLYVWIMCQILPASRADTEIVKRLNQPSDDPNAWTLNGLQESKIRGKDRILRIAFKLTRWLYADLVRECRKIG